MKINHLKINGFGKFINEDIEFKDKVNIVYGSNEAGKSTIQKFIHGVLFGISKNKNNKSISEYDKYYPWNGIEYSGKISYTLDNKEKYEVFRDFLKKESSIYDERNNDISLKYKIDKTKGNMFFEEQTGVDEELFLNTAVSEQQNVKLNKSSQFNIIQKITNLVSSGDENISYNKTMEKILKMQIEKVGNNRTTQKPINIINNNIEKLEKDQLELRNLKLELDDILAKEIEEQINLEKENNKINLVRDMKNYLDSSKINIAEVDFNKRLEEEYDEKILDLKNKIDIRSKQNIRIQKKKYVLNFVLEIIFIILSIFLPLVLHNYYFAIPFILLSIINLVILIILKINNNKEINIKLKQIDDLQSKIDKEIEILKKSKEQKKFEIQIKNERLNLSIIKNEEMLSEKYHGKIEETFIEKVFSMDMDDLVKLEYTILNNINEIKINLYSINEYKENIELKINKLESLDNKINELSNEKEKLDLLNNSFNLAIETLQEAYKDMKEQIRPNLTEKLCKIILKISDGKYKNIVFDDEKGLCLELESGQYISCERLSIGTMDEIYLSLRLSVLQDITKEKLPIILDESFAYFDNERLKNFLEFLKNEYSENQVIIFTCSNREVEVFKNIGFSDYNYIELK